MDDVNLEHRLTTIEQKVDVLTIEVGKWAFAQKEQNIVVLQLQRELHDHPLTCEFRGSLTDHLGSHVTYDTAKSARHRGRAEVYALIGGGIGLIFTGVSGLLGLLFQLGVI